MKFLPQGRLVSISADSCVFVWRLSAFIREAIDKKMEEMGKLFRVAVGGFLSVSVLRTCLLFCFRFYNR